MKFVEPFYLLLIPVAAVAAAVLFSRAAARKKMILRQILGDRAESPLAVHLASCNRKWKHILLGIAMLLLLAAASRPYINTVSRDVESSGSDILILFDVSKSMRATDLPPSRLEQAKFLMREIIKAFPQDRFGVIPFAGSAFLSCPLTADHTALAEAAADLSTESVPLGGTNIEAALQCADRAFSGADSDHRAVLLLTDGDELSGNTAAVTADFRKRGIPVVVAGFGDPAVAAPVPDGAGGVMRSADGKAAGSRLNETSLQKIAAETGGIYVRSTAADTGSKVITEFLQQLAAKAFASQTHREVDDLFPYFILAALVILTAAALLPERLRNRSVLLLVLLSALPVAGAEEKLLALPENPYELYAQGRKQQLAGDKSAAQYYEKAVQLPGTNESVRSASLHNLGVLSHLDGREMLNKARAMLESQQLDEAEKSVTAAGEKFNGTEELYTRSMQSAGVPQNSEDISGGNFRQLLLDRKQAEELKKAIEELKKQQQQAQQQTQQAQQQNKQQQQQQQNQQNQKNQQQNQQQNQAQQQTQQAQQAAKELAQKANELKQDKLEKSANEARQKLEEAEKLQQQGKFDEAQKKLDEAAGKLGQDKKQENSRSGQEKPAGGKPENDTESGSAPSEAEKAQKSEKERAGERKLELLDDEAKALREAVRRRNMRRTPVEKDW